MALTTVDRILLSGSTDGRQIKVAATATAGTLIHTATNTAGQIDFVTIYATNDHTADLLLTLEWGGVTSPDDLVRETIPARSGRALVVPGLPLQGGVALRAFAASANLILLSGFVERATST
jgi:hypothetical protein